MQVARSTRSSRLADLLASASSQMYLEHYTMRLTALSGVTAIDHSQASQLQCNFETSAAPCTRNFGLERQQQSSIRVQAAAVTAHPAARLHRPLNTAAKCALPSVPHRGFAAQSKADEYDLIEMEAGLVRVDGYTPTGFIVNDITTEGPLLCLRTSFFNWAVRGLDDVTPASLSAIQLLNPLPEVLVVGTGGSLQPLPPELVRHLAARGIGVEAADTVNAMATFNILAQEGRHVAGAFLPLGFRD